MRGINGKRFIVAGGATGMGAALASRLVEEGARVVVGDINEPALMTTVAELKGKGGDAVAVTFDLSDQASIGRLVERCAAEFGGLDGLAITAADLSASTLGNDFDVLRTDLAIWQRTLTVNLVGHALLIREAIPHLVAAGGGSIVSVSSLASYFGYADIPAYAASKAGLNALVRHVARLCGKDKIRCNAVAPGLVMTEGARVNLKQETMESILANSALPRLGEPDDLASSMLFLLSDESTWITGQVIAVNGGVAFRD
jgi:NAD(P)-dependent dehydrogenase (short-subunit alcohol dehydrogenase family)